MNAVDGLPRRWFDSDATHLDVRGLKPPEPMVAILSLIEAGVPGVLIVHLDRDPVFLYPELAERGWVATRVDADPDDVRLRLERAP